VKSVGVVDYHTHNTLYPWIISPIQAHEEGEDSESEEDDDSDFDDLDQYIDSTTASLTTATDYDSEETHDSTFKLCNDKSLWLSAFYFRYFYQTENQLYRHLINSIGNNTIEIFSSSNIWLSIKTELPLLQRKSRLQRRTFKLILFNLLFSTF